MAKKKKKSEIRIKPYHITDELYEDISSEALKNKRGMADEVVLRLEKKKPNLRIS